MKIDVVVESSVKPSIRARQVCSMFDVPFNEKTHLEWKGALPIEDKPWSVGLIVGPSGCGKSTIAKELWGLPPDMEWSPKKSVIDDVAPKLTVEEVTNALGAVGFNTIPAWVRPFHVLSNGERFRVEIARRMLETPASEPIVIDEFTSVVDRQVAKIASHAVQKFVRKTSRQFVAVSCHHDIIDWLQPDWILEPATMSFQWRSLQRRPEVECVVSAVPYAAWRIFAPFHYLTADLHRSARCWGLFVDDRIVSIACTLHRPHPHVRNLIGLSRGVTLPDFQGLGLIPRLVDTIASMYTGLGKEFHNYPAHPSLIRVYDKSPLWTMIKRPGMGTGATTNRKSNRRVAGEHVGKFGGRPNAVFSYVGPKMPKPDAERLYSGLEHV